MHFPRFCAIAFLLLLLGGMEVAQAQSLFGDGFETPSTVTNSSEAARFLQQATFGPTLADIQDLERLGNYAAWIDAQLAYPPSYETPYVEWVNGTSQDARVEAWFLHVIGGPDPGATPMVHRDQLRQRMAFALSQIFVVSDRAAAIGREVDAMTDYYDMLIEHAFGNYRDLLEAVTLHPVMGHYLSAFRNQRPDPVLNIRPDENYAREILQLFSVGLVRLNPDGTPMLQNGVPIPAYDQTTIKGFAHVFTGWNWAGCEGAVGGWEFCVANWQEPMEPFEAYHDSTTDKQLLQYPGVQLPGGVLVRGGDARAEMDAALDNIFNHPNVGPFLARQLIQRFVTSNPTPDYVRRVADRFADNGAGVRGDLAAVLRAVLLDPEAREGHLRDIPRYGKLREPILRLTHLWRAMDGRAESGRFREGNPEMAFSQAPLRAPSVFNFFMPSYAPRGAISAAGLVAPEFQVMTDSGLTSQANGLGEFIFYAYREGGQLENDVSIDVGRDQELARDIPALVDRYNLVFMAGQMSPEMRQTLITHLGTHTAASSGAYLRNRIQDAVFLILNSPEYAVQK